MSNQQYKNLLKYSVISLISIAILSYVPTERLSPESIILLTLCILIFVFLVNNYVTGEGMDVIASNNVLKNWFYEYKEPRENLYDGYIDDYNKSGFEFSSDMPGYYLANNGKFSENGVSFNDVNNLIASSKAKYLQSQYNYDLKPTELMDFSGISDFASVPEIVEIETTNSETKCDTCK